MACKEPAPCPLGLQIATARSVQTRCCVAGMYAPESSASMLHYLLHAEIGASTPSLSEICTPNCASCSHWWAILMQPAPAVRRSVRQKEAVLQSNACYEIWDCEALMLHGLIQAGELKPLPFVKQQKALCCFSSKRETLSSLDGPSGALEID
eukprot:4722312-Pleurochrysis_carterae.AAC.1